MTQPILSLNRLRQVFDGVTAVDALTMDIAKGEIFGFLGHNGAGKTTTVQMLTTLAKPASGTATVAGHDICADPLAVRHCIGYVPENVRLYDTLTARENLMFFARLSGLTAPLARVNEVLALLDCTYLADKRVGGFSKGMRQRIGLAQAILHQPQVLFLDEPTSGLDFRADRHGGERAGPFGIRGPAGAGDDLADADIYCAATDRKPESDSGDQPDCGPRGPTRYRVFRRNGAGAGVGFTGGCLQIRRGQPAGSVARRDRLACDHPPRGCAGSGADGRFGRHLARPDSPEHGARRLQCLT